VAELVGVDHRANRLDLPVEDVEPQGVEYVTVPVADDRTPFPEGVEESSGQFLALLAVGLEPGPARVHVAARLHRELAAGRPPVVPRSRSSAAATARSW
jgi:hypothetical protein